MKPSGKASSYFLRLGAKVTRFCSKQVIAEDGKSASFASKQVFYIRCACFSASSRCLLLDRSISRLMAELSGCLIRLSALLLVNYIKANSL